MAAVRDVILAIVLLFMFGMGFFVINFVTHTAVDKLVSIPTINDTTVAKDAFNDTATTSNRMDYIIFGLFLALTFGIIITGWFVGGNPIFMFFYFIVSVIGVVVSMILSNVWNDMANASVFGTTISNFPITNFLLSNLPLLSVVLGVLGMVVMFTRPTIANQL